MHRGLPGAFAQLRRSGIIALQNAGYTQSDGWSDVAEKREQAERAGQTVRGAVFYHGQDAARARAGGVLYLAFGSFADDPAHEPESIALGREVCTVLEAHGMTVQWDGSIGSRIAVLPEPKPEASAEVKEAPAKATVLRRRPGRKTDAT